MYNKVFHKFNQFEWDGIEKIDYKPSDSDTQITFNNTSRQNLVEKGQDTKFHLRYFECGNEGFSTLEKHNHVHVVIIARGKGKVIVGTEIYNAEPMDLMVIPPWAEHQLINTGTEPFGFFCVVDGERDKFTTLSKSETDNLSKNSSIKENIKIPKKYYLED